MQGTRGAGEPDMCTDRMASRFVGCRYGLCIRSVFRNSAAQQDHLKMKSALEGDRGRSVLEKEYVTVDLHRGASPSF